MTSPVDICNMALGQIGEQITIQSISPPKPPTVAANTAALYYAPKISSLMRAAPWNFTRATRSLTLLKSAMDLSTGAPSANPPPLPFLFEYLYPPECLDARFIPRFSNLNTSSVSSSVTPLTTAPNATFWPVLTAEVPATFVVAMDTDSNGNQIKVILTDEPFAILVYTARIDDCNLWDANFVDAAVHTLAAFFVNPLNRNAALMKQNIDIARQIIAEARVSDGNEGINSQDHVPDFIQIRGTYGGVAGWGFGPNGGGGWTGWSWSSMSFPGGLSY